MNKWVLLLALRCVPAWGANYKSYTADADSDVVRIRGPIQIHVSGDDGGGTLTCYYLALVGTYKALSGAVFTAADDVVVDVPDGVLTDVKCTLAGSTTPTLYLEVRGQQ